MRRLSNNHQKGASQVQTIKDMRKNRILEQYQSFDIKGFLNSKVLRIEGVKRDTVRSEKCIKITLRIVEDNDGETNENTGEFTPYNRGKVFTYLIYRNQFSDEDGSILEGKYEEIKENIGHHITLDDDTVLERYIYRRNFLTIIGDEYTVLDETSEIEPSSNQGDRSLKKISHYKRTDVDKFLNETPIELSPLYKGKGNHLAMFNAFVDDENYIVFAVHVDDVEDCPSELLRQTFRFDRDVANYEVDYLTASGYGTRWIVYFNHITLKPGALGYEPYRIGRITESTQPAQAELQINQNLHQI